MNTSAQLYGLRNVMKMPEVAKAELHNDEMLVVFHDGTHLWVSEDIGDIAQVVKNRISKNFNHG